MGIDFNGVNGNSPLFGTNKTNSTDDVKKQQKIDFGFNFSTNEIGDSFGTKKTTLLEQMMEIAAKGDVKLDSKRNKEIDDTIAMIYADDVEDVAGEFVQYDVPFDKQDLDTIKLIRQNITNPLA